VDTHSDESRNDIHIVEKFEAESYEQHRSEYQVRLMISTKEEILIVEVV